MGSKIVIHPELGKLGKGNCHPDYPDLKFCLVCEEFKDKFWFTERKSSCKKCRAESNKDAYWDNPEKREYHVKKQREATGGVKNPHVFFGRDKEEWFDY